MNVKDVVCFDTFGVQHIKREFKKFIENKNIVTNIYGTQAYNSMCWHFCMGFIDFEIKGKSLLEYANLFSSDVNRNNDKIILK